MTKGVNPGIDMCEKSEIVAMGFKNRFIANSYFTEKLTIRKDRIEIYRISRHL